MPPAVSQPLGVSHSQDTHGGGRLQYRLVPIGGTADAVDWPDAVDHPVALKVLENAVEAVRDQVNVLGGLAVNGQPRGPVGIEDAAARLAQNVLPPAGFLGVMPVGVNPLFDTVHDAAALIPWEVLPERYLVCEGTPGHPVVVVSPVAAPPTFCGECRAPLRPGGDWLVLNRRLGHVVRGRAQSGNVGKEFLLVVDPTGDLCRDPGGVCAAHLVKVQTLLRDAGYQVAVRSGPTATVRQLRTDLGKKTVVGFYYFGHGYYSAHEDQGCLALADGQLYASEIEQLNPTIPFAFVNACLGAATGKNWIVERRFRSVGQALAAGRAKVMVAALWPVINVQAAEAAVTFFTEALAGKPLGDALHAVRAASHERYAAGEPHISWLAYRYFGDPTRTLPPPADPARPAAPLFDKDGKLDRDRFGFEIDAVLRRARRRQREHGRAVVGVADFVAGLVRVGDLTRFALREQKTDPDAAYKGLLAAVEPPSPGAAPSQTCDDPPARRDDFHPDLVAVLDRSAPRPTAAGPAADVTERAVLLALTDGDRWPTVVPPVLPPAGEVRAWLAGARAAAVDANGQLRLDGLDPAARKAVERAHTLAQQRGYHPIPNRLVLAALLASLPDGPAAAVRGQGVAADELCALMLALTDGKEPGTYALSPDAAAGAVRPMLDRAGVLAEGGPVNPACLFRAFCQTANPGFRAFLAGLPRPWALDLKAFAAGDPPPAYPALVPYAADLKNSAWSVLVRAADLARQANWPEIRTRHVFLAMLERLSTRRMKEHGIDVDRLRAELRTMAAQGAPGDRPVAAAAIRVAPHVGEVLRLAVVAARADGRTQASAHDFLDGMAALMKLNDQKKAGTATAVGATTVATGGADLVAGAAALPPVVGRDAEVDALAANLTSDDGGNPLLVGAPGVGRMAVVHGAARRLAADAPVRLIPLTGADLRGGWLPGERVVAVIENLLLALDDAGAAAGLQRVLDAGRVVATTTPAGERTLAERHPELMARFRPQPIRPPDRAAAVEMVAAHRARLEARFGTTVGPAAVAAAVDLTGEHQPDRPWPGTACAVLERACRLARGRPEVTRADVGRALADELGVSADLILGAGG